MPSEYAIITEGLSYKFPNNDRVGLYDINIHLKKGSRLLLVGPNGAGKSTLLKILAGQKLINMGTILLDGVNPFELSKTQAARDAHNQFVVTYLGTEWANNEITKRDIPVILLVNSIGGEIYPERRDELINLLDIDITWRMNQISDGERRRVQLLMGLLKPWNLLLLDEVTIDLDVLVRSRLMDFLRLECETRSATVVYATHIFDGLGTWPTEIEHLSGGVQRKHYSLQDVKFVNKKSEIPVSNLEVEKTDSFHPLALEWLHEDLEARGERTDDKTRPKWSEVSEKAQSTYFDKSDRVTDYFLRTRKI
ncbi:unnamed protein product [Kuraishia capsulata CBS 1993]|uniref:ABC transporter domain-containing protein n=1 Tax=Kuraishia capsulata CBS 1993 TaxID=1382522 RepID=W6MQW8_9ASCO|nr:uncharacterized protein KUCA_T00005058001 [Kuraishia capsulata CBS 1993]CDK29071.1 unnamed protein product [Kuraishia capsulata CBS 1993]